MNILINTLLNHFFIWINIKFVKIKITFNAGVLCKKIRGTFCLNIFLDLLFIFFSIFQPLRVTVDEKFIKAIDDFLNTKSDKEDCLRCIFQQSRYDAQSAVKCMLKEFWNKQKLGEFIKNLIGLIFFN